MRTPNCLASRETDEPGQPIVRDPQKKPRTSTWAVRFFPNRRCALSLTTTAAYAWPRSSCASMRSLTLGRRRGSAIFLGALVLMMALSVVAFVEPSPGDVGIAILFTFGTLFGKLVWHRIPTVPVLLLSLFVFANFVSSFYATDLAFAMSFSAITSFMLILWLFTIGFVSKYEEAGIRALLTGFTAGGVLSASLSLLAYFGILTKLSSVLPILNSLQLSDTVLFFGERIRGLFKDPNVFGPYLVVVSAYATI